MSRETDPDSDKYRCRVCGHAKEDHGLAVDGDGVVVAGTYIGELFTICGAEGSVPARLTLADLVPMATHFAAARNRLQHSRTIDLEADGVWAALITDMETLLRALPQSLSDLSFAQGQVAILREVVAARPAGPLPEATGPGCACGPGGNPA